MITWGKDSVVDHNCCLWNTVLAGLSVEQIRGVFGDNQRIIFVSSQ